MIKSKLYGKFNQEKVFESCMVTGQPRLARANERAVDQESL